MRKKLCRAAACPRHVDDTRLFCNVHLGQLTPRLLEPIRDNREAPASAADSQRKAIDTAVADAVTHLAKLEGRASSLRRARKSGSVAINQGGAGDASTSAGSGTVQQSKRGTIRVDLEGGKIP